MIKRIFITTALIGIFTNSLGANWTPIRPGLFYLTQKPRFLRGYANIVAIKIDPSRYQFRIANAKQLLNQPAAFVRTLAIKSHAPIAINGGYFGTNSQPLGLRVSNYRKTSRKKNISWWGIFAINNHQPRIYKNRSFKASKQTEFAIQAGPRLVINHRIPKLKPGVAERSAICITQSNQVIIAVTQHYPITLEYWAEQLSKAPYNCKNALNLDGGRSSQLYINTKAFKFSVANYSRVADAITINH